MASQYNLISDIDKTDLYFSVKHNNPDKCINDLSNIKNKLTIIHQNICSIQKNFDNFVIFLTRLKFSPDLIILTECRLSDDTPKFNINNYDCYYSQHYLNQNDGLAVFYKNSLQVSIEEPEFLDANCLTIQVGQELTICAIYRSPSFYYIQNFCSSLEKVIQSFKTATCAIIGDMNIDIKIGTKDKRSIDYLDITGHYGFYPGHLYPTHDRNCLDHALFKTTGTAAQVTVCDAGITDHDTLVIAMENKATCPNSKLDTENHTTKINYPSLIKDIENIDWTPIYQHTDVSIALANFTSTLSSKIELHSTKTILRNSKSIRKPWISENLLKCIRKRDLLHKEAKKKGNENDLSIQLRYKNYRNYCNNTIQNLKNEYERELLIKAKGDSKRTWTAVKKICNLKRENSPNSHLLNAEQEKRSSLNVVNRYFCTVGDELAEKTMERLKSTEAELVNINHTLDDSKLLHCDSFFAQPTDEVEIHGIITRLKSDSAPGWDGIGNRVLKNAKHCLAAPITFLCNLSMETGTVPQEMKIANVCPIYKSGDKQVAANYRPISLLSSLSKILEKVMNKRLLNYLEHRNFLSKNQYGFRGNRSTEDAVTNLVDSVIAKLDKGKKCTGVFLDLAKAFDTVSRPILLKKMETIGIRGTALGWFNSYLTDRRQRVGIGGLFSEYMSTKYGIPQGSVLGPTLFIIYINGLCELQLDNAEIFAYADDTAIIFHGKTWNDAHTMAEVGMQTIANWLSHNLLTLNTDKTKVVNFCVTKRTMAIGQPPLKLHTCKNSNIINCGCAILEQTNSIKYLGVYIDCHLTWSKQIEYLSSRIRKLSHIFKKMRSISDASLINTLYLALCQSVLSYCIVSWGVASKTHLINIERAQRSVLKVAYHKKRRYSTDALYKETGLLRVRQLYILATILKFHKKALNSVLDSHRSQRKPRWKKEMCKLRFGGISFSYMGPYLYNKINNKLDMVELTKFKCKKLLTNWLLTLDYANTEQILTSTYKVP